MKEKELERMKEAYKNISVPENTKKLMEDKIMQAKKEKQRQKFTIYKKAGMGLAAAFAVAFIGVNTSSTIAYAMGDIPVLGKLFEVITVREYDWHSENHQQSIHAEIPEVSQKDIEGKDTETESVKQVNKSAEEYIEELVAQFQAEMADNEQGYASLDISHEVLTDNEKYFSLDIAAVDTQASGYEFHKYYTIDKQKDRIIELKDLFETGEDYVAEISEEIIRQMKADPETPYFIGEQEEGFEGFTKIDENQNFYINEQGQLVIAFDEYEVGPGYIGAPQFVIENK